MLLPVAGDGESFQPLAPWRGAGHRCDGHLEGAPGDGAQRPERGGCRVGVALGNRLGINAKQHR